MKLKIYSVVEKTPPINETLILWKMEGKEIIEMKFIEACIAIPDDEEERALVPSGVHPEMIWDNGYDMHYEDMWSYSVTENGD